MEVDAHEKLDYLEGQQAATVVACKALIQAVRGGEPTRAAGEAVSRDVRSFLEVAERDILTSDATDRVKFTKGFSETLRVFLSALRE